MTFDASYLRKRLDIPTDMDVAVQNVTELAEVDLFDLPHVKKLISYTLPTTEQLMRRRYLEVDYTARYTVGERELNLAGNTYIVAPLDPGDPAPMLTHLTGSMRGFGEFLFDDYLADPDGCWYKSTEAMSAPLMSLLLQQPVHVICKGGPGVRREFADEEAQDEVGRSWTRCFAEKTAAAEALRDAGFQLQTDKTLVGGISRGGFDSLLLAAFDPTVTHVFSVAGVSGFCEFASLSDRVRLFTRPDLVAEGIETPDILALIEARTQSSFALTDGEIRPMHLTLLCRANEKRKAAGRAPIAVKCFEPAPGQRGHGWPLREAISYYFAALSE